MSLVLHSTMIRQSLLPHHVMRLSKARWRNEASADWMCLTSIICPYLAKIWLRADWLIHVLTVTPVLLLLRPLTINWEVSIWRIPMLVLLRSLICLIKLNEVWPHITLGRRVHILEWSTLWQHSLTIIHHCMPHVVRIS